jgi:hypothetical protein
MSNSKVQAYAKDLIKVHGNEYALRLAENTLVFAVGKNANFFKEVIIELKRIIK